MATSNSSLLFAPQVPSVYPAFVYTGSGDPNEAILLKIKLYNSTDDFTSIRYSIIDPSSGESVITDQDSDSFRKFDPIKNLYYLEDSDMSDYNANTHEITIGLIQSRLKLLTYDKYYQIQFWLNRTVTEGSGDKAVTYSNDSPLSQIALLRPFCGFNKVVVNEFGKTLNGDLGVFNEYTIKSLSGYFEPSITTSKEYIKQYSYSILKKEDSTTLIYESPNINNNLGFNFKVPSFNEKLLIPNTFDSNTEIFTDSYLITINYETVNGYKGSAEGSFCIQALVDPNSEQIFKTNGFTPAPIPDLDLVQVDFSDTYKNIGKRIGENEVEIEPEVGDKFTIIFQKEETPRQWIQIAEFDLPAVPPHPATLPQSLPIRMEEPKYGCTYLDYRRSQMGKKHTYRMVVLKDNVPFKYTDSYSITPPFNNVILLDKNYAVVVNYNQNISGFKWVTQEAVTNTLGGKFPIIRVAGETYYRQFNLSGTFDFSGEAGGIMEHSCSSIVKYAPEKECGIFLSNNEKKKFTNVNQTYRERELKMIAMQFLTNKAPKLFRSYEEGDMIVHLSNVSFTPNRVTDRRTLDFSATVTEICEATEENLKKYNLIPDNYICGYEI